MWQQAKNIYHLVVALVVGCYFGFPARGMIIIGVTGTDGKTTSASLIYHILSISGKNAALISTVGAIIKGKEYDTGFHVTTPSSIALQSYLKRAKNVGVEYVVLEVTSHALDQNRTLCIPFAIGVLTNITREHLDYHKTYENYVVAKSRLIQSANTGILNKDDASYPLVVKILKGKKKIITYGMTDADYTKQTISSFKTNLIGDYNLYNMLAATAVSDQLGISMDNIKKAVETFTLPKGRAEVVYCDAFTVMIDFAHTPNAFKQLLSTLKKTKNHGKIIHVFGAAGQRDVSKRPFMGEIASEFDDCIIITAEDPRSEPVDKIIAEITSGIIQLKDYPKVYKISDRQAAIDFAISIAGKGDVVVVTGKGHEESMNLGRGEIAWSDHEAVKKAIAKRYEK